MSARELSDRIRNAVILEVDAYEHEDYDALIEAALLAARTSALEEAAQLFPLEPIVAARIRALKSRPTPEPHTSGSDE